MSETGQQANQILGFPLDARLLIVNCDDFGMCHSINEATLQSLQQGLATSCTIMAPCPWSLHGLYLLQENPTIPFGIHLTVVSEQPHYRWSSTAPQHQVPSLLDERGYFHPGHRLAELLEKAELTELENEFRAQIEFVLASGLKPTHLDSHFDVHARREDIFDMTFGLAREYGLGMRVGKRRFADKLRQQGYAVDDYDLLDSYDLPTEDKLNTYLKLLRGLKPGLSEWALHPGIPNAELMAAIPSWQVREADFNFLMSSQARAVAEEEGIIFLDHRRLQELWSAKH
jgi:hypothetical protein